VITCFYLFAFQFLLVADRLSSTYTAYLSVVEPQSSCYQTEVSIILYHCSSPTAYTSLASLLFAYRYTRLQCSLHVIRLSVSIVRLHIVVTISRGPTINCTLNQKKKKKKPESRVNNFNPMISPEHHDVPDNVTRSTNVDKQLNVKGKRVTERVESTTIVARACETYLSPMALSLSIGPPHVR